MHWVERSQVQQQVAHVLAPLTTKIHEPITLHKETTRAASSNYTQPYTTAVRKVAVTKVKIGDQEVHGLVFLG